MSKNYEFGFGEETSTIAPAPVSTVYSYPSITSPLFSLWDWFKTSNSIVKLGILGSVGFMLYLILDGKRKK